MEKKKKKQKTTLRSYVKGVNTSIRMLEINPIVIIFSHLTPPEMLYVASQSLGDREFFETNDIWRRVALKKYGTDFQSTMGMFEDVVPKGRRLNYYWVMLSLWAVSDFETNSDVILFTSFYAPYKDYDFYFKLSRANRLRVHFDKYTNELIFSIHQKVLNALNKEFSLSPTKSLDGSIFDFSVPFDSTLLVRVVYRILSTIRRTFIQAFPSTAENNPVYIRGCYTNNASNFYV